MARLGTTTSSQQMSLMGHIQELQRRLVLSALFLIVAGSTAYVFKDQILSVLLEPLGGQKLMYLNPAGGFSFILMVSIYAGIAFSAPLLLHQVYCFMRPALSENVQRKSVQVLFSSSLLLLTGVMFGYLFAIPGALQFLQEFAGDYVNASLTADAYLQFIVSYTLGLGLVFQLPLLLMLIHWIKPLTPSGLVKSERWIIILSFVAAAIITPTPDPLNQTIIALPIVVVYQLGVFAVLINIYKAKRKSKLVEKRQSAIPAVTQPVPQPQAPSLVTSPALSTAASTPQLHANPVPTARAFRSMDGIRTQPMAKQLPSRPLMLPPARQTTSPDRPTIRKHAPRFAIDGISPSFQLSR